MISTPSSCSARTNISAPDNFSTVKPSVGQTTRAGTAAPSSVGNPSSVLLVCEKKALLGFQTYRAEVGRHGADWWDRMAVSLLGRRGNDARIPGRSVAGVVRRAVSNSGEP